MNSNDLTDPRKDQINGSANNGTSQSFTFRVNKEADLIETRSVESTEFNCLLAQYKARVLERYAYLYKF